MMDSLIALENKMVVFDAQALMDSEMLINKFMQFCTALFWG
jgi:hypothetical protein